MSSIREVAKLAGVSPATVSRVMNGTANVDSEKKQRVLNAISETGFIPNEVARSLFRKSAKLIGLIIPSIQNPYFTQLASAIGEAAQEKGYRVFLCDVGMEGESIQDTLQMLASKNADGVVLAAHAPQLEQTLSGLSIPVVAIDCLQSAEHVRASIYCDYYAGGRMAMEHLLESGCKNIVCIKSDQEIFSARMRYEGYRDVCRERGIPEQTVDCDYDFRAGLAMTEHLLQKYPHVDGILACNDIVAISTYKVLHKRQISVPEQVQLIGFDDIRLTSLVSPELSTIHQPIREMAYRAVDILTGKDSSHRPEPIVLPVYLVKRETTEKKSGYEKTGDSER